MKRKTTPTPTPAAVATLNASDLLRMSDSDYDAARAAARAGNVAPVVANRVEYAYVARLQFAVSRYTHLLRYRNVAERVARYMDASFDRWVSMWIIDDVVIYEDATPTPAAVARCAPAILTAMLSQPVAPTPTLYATLVAGRVDYCYPEVLTTTSYATIADWVAGECVRNHPDTIWVVRTVGTSVDVGTHVVYVDGRGDVLTMHASMVDVAEMVRYYAGGMAGDLGATLDTCYTAYDVVAAVCNHLVATGCDPFDIDGEFVAMMMHTGDYDSSLTNQDMETYANMWYKSLPLDDDDYTDTTPTGDGVRCGVCGFDVSDTDDGWCQCLDVATSDDDDNHCRGCGCEIVYAFSHVYDDDWYCGLCYTDMIARDE